MSNAGDNHTTDTIVSGGIIARSRASGSGGGRPDVRSDSLGAWSRWLVSAERLVRRIFGLGLLLIPTFLLGVSPVPAQQISQSGGGVVSIHDYDVAADGVTDDSEAFAQALKEIGNTEMVLVISGDEFVLADITFPSNVTLSFRGGGVLRIPADRTIRINGAIEAGLDQIFTGDGLVTGHPENVRVYPQWFGAQGDGEHDDAWALQQAADLAAQSAGGTLFIPRGEYLFKEDVEFRSNIESRGRLIKEIEIDEERTEVSNFTFVPTHYPKNNPYIEFVPDHEAVKLAAEPFYGIEEGQFEVPVFEEVPLADGSGAVDLGEGGTLRFYSSDFFSSRRNQKGDQYYDRNDISQVVSGRGDVFPEFAFDYPAPPDAESWSADERYEKGDYVSYGGEVFKATWRSGPGSQFEDRYLGTIDIGPVAPKPGQSTTEHDFVFDDGSADDIRIWRRVEMEVWYRPKDRPLTVNGLRVRVRLLDHGGESKRISAGAVTVSRSNMTFNNLEITVRDREATMARLLNVRQAVNLAFNNCYISGATYHGLGYNILNSNVANVRYNDCVSTNSRKGLDGRHGKNVTIDGGFYNVINDHYGRNYVIRDVTMSGKSTDIPGYVTPDADLQEWHFRTIQPFAYSGANLTIENVTVNEGSGGILAVRGDIGDFYGTIRLEDITVRRNEGDVRLIRHSIDPDFDFAGPVRTPNRMIVEDVYLQNPGRLAFVIGQGFNSGYDGMIEIRHTGPIGDVYSGASDLTFSDCVVQDGEFEASAGATISFKNCRFLGASGGLDADDIGVVVGNTRADGATVSFPIGQTPGERTGQ